LVQNVPRQRSPSIEAVYHEADQATQHRITHEHSGSGHSWVLPLSVIVVLVGLVGAAGLLYRKFGPSDAQLLPHVGWQAETAAAAAGGAILAGAAARLGARAYTARQEANATRSRSATRAHLVELQEQHDELLSQVKQVVDTVFDHVRDATTRFKRQQGLLKMVGIEEEHGRLVQTKPTPSILPELVQGGKVNALITAPQHALTLLRRFEALAHNEGAQLVVRFQAYASNEDTGALRRLLQQDTGLPAVQSELQTLFSKYIPLQTSDKVTFDELLPYLPYL
jgi:hypothetical protein